MTPGTTDMSIVRYRVIALIVAASVVTTYGQSSPANRPWPPGVQKVSDQSPPLSPADALKTFYMPPGYHLELVASEPLVQDPTVMDWDLEGRLWVVEMTGFVRSSGRTRTESRSNRQRGRARRHRPRRTDGQADGVRRWPDSAAGLEGARSRRARRRAGQPLADARHERRPAGRHQGARLGRVRPAGGQRRGKRERRLLGARQPAAHGRTGERVLSPEGPEVRGAEHAGARRVGRDAGRRGAHLPQYERIGAARGLRADGVLRAQPESPAHARQLRGAARSGQRHQHRLAGAPESGTNRAYQTGIDRADGTLANSRRCARRWCIGAIGCRRSSTGTRLSRSRPRTSSAASS